MEWRDGVELAAGRQRQFIDTQVTYVLLTDRVLGWCPETSSSAGESGTWPLIDLRGAC